VRVLKVSIEGSPLQRVCPAADTGQQNWEKVAIGRSRCLGFAFFWPFAYLSRMRNQRSAAAFRRAGPRSPTGRSEFHEIKHDGYRLIVQRKGKTVRLWTHNGYDLSSRYPRIVEAALRHRPESFALDGEAALLGVDGIADFNGLHSRKHDDEVQLYAFDVLMSAGDDLRPLPLHLRKNHLAKMVRRRVDGT